jgi:hypothetical protein
VNLPRAIHRPGKIGRPVGKQAVQLHLWDLGCHQPVQMNSVGGNAIGDHRQSDPVIVARFLANWLGRWPME